jgi:CRISPR-associated endonuclease/helicase Cas3
VSLPSFEALFVAVYGYEPFPWQRRLAEQVVREGWDKHSLLDLPTGAGKTSALDIALYALACAPERMPRRTVLVVDRRIVVDEGARRARALLRALTNATAGPARVVADALRELAGATANGAPFAVSIMRGGMPRDDDWARAPEMPVLGLSTVDQIGSRMFFRGYGIPSRSASIHAGLLGNDTLILLDEVHLAEPFAQTLDAARRLRSATSLPDRFAVVRMSATPGVRDDTARFCLDDEDRQHEVLSRRLRASKSAQLVPVKVSGYDEAKKLDAVADAAAHHALDLKSKGAQVVGVVLNRVDGARRAHAKLKAHVPSSILVTGRMRPIDRDSTVRRLQPLAGPRNRSATGEALVVVATQCLEAGADLDFDALVAECASLDALRQRFGRLDRRGQLGQSSAVILGRSDSVSSSDGDPIYGGALKSTWSWLEANAREGAVDFGIEALPPGADRELLAPRPNAPVLLPAHIEAWAQTSPVPDFDPDLGIWLHGPEKPGADVRVVFRSDLLLPPDHDAEASAAVERLLAARPSSLEVLAVPIGAARRWLAGERVSPIADVLSGDTEPDEIREGDAKPVVALRWRGDGSEWVRADELRPGDTLIVPTDRGGIRDHSFDPESTEAVLDLGDLAALRGRAIAQLRLGPTALAVWGLPTELTDTVPKVDAEETVLSLRDRVRTWMRTTPEALPEASLATEAEWSAFRSAFTQSKSRVQVARTGDGAVLHVRLDPSQLREDAEVVDAITEDDDSSFIEHEVTLREHSDDVRTVVGRVARSLRLPSEFQRDLELAAWLHDVGKADERFQRWLVGGSEIAAAALSEPLAKSRFPGTSPKERRRAQERAGYPTSYRHELLSLAMARDNRDALATAHDADLVLHLVASHHGFARPFAPFDDHPEEIPVALEHGGVRLEATTRHRLGRLGSEVPARFHRLQGKYGWWGLAWLEAILRLADHHASRIRAEGGAP